MIEFPRDAQNTIPTASVKIVGIGGAGANMIDRVALDGLDGAELLALNTDIRTLSATAAGEKVQLGRNLTKGLGTGGDPELGNQAVMEAEGEIRSALKGRKIVFICVGLGGGTGSGAAPIVARIAREEGAFVVMFATMPFNFEGRRRKEQAETSLNELAVLSNALVTFDNGRMGELVLAKQGIHEAFAAADRMISESIKAVIRLVVRPGLINIGLDDLMSALRTTRSRCLFGSGLAEGKDRAQKALRNAMSSPLLDQGALLKDADTVLVHLCGGEDLTLFEIELLMENLAKHVPEKAHVLFGAAVDPSMGDQLSITLVSSLPEERLRQKVEERRAVPTLEPSVGFAAFGDSASPVVKKAGSWLEPRHEPAPLDEEEVEIEPAAEDNDLPEVGGEDEPDVGEVFEQPLDEPGEAFVIKGADKASREAEEARKEMTEELAPEPEEQHDAEIPEDDGASDLEWGDESLSEREEMPFAESIDPFKPPGDKDSGANAGRVEKKTFLQDPVEEPFSIAGSPADEEVGQVRKKGGTRQSELSFGGGPKGRFEGADPNLFEGEDLDVPAFLRKKPR